MQVQIGLAFDNPGSIAHGATRVENLRHARSPTECATLSITIDEFLCSDVLEQAAVVIGIDEPILIDISSTCIEVEVLLRSVGEVKIDPWRYEQVNAVEYCFHIEGRL